MEISSMAVASIQHVLSGKFSAGETVTVQGWVRTRRDSKAGLSFINVSDGSCFAPIQIVAPAILSNYESEVKRLSASCSLRATGVVAVSD
jgi:asparaginyl-tRNA synthetase